MKKFIYKTLMTNGTPIQDYELDKLGSEGWELIAVRDTDGLHSPIYYFKKETTQNV